MFLAHYTGSGIDAVLDLDIEDYFVYMDAAVELYKTDIKTPKRAIVVGFEK